MDWSGFIIYVCTDSDSGSLQLYGCCQYRTVPSFSVHNYVTLFTTPELLNMILGSVILAVGSGLIATILGTSGAIGAFYSKKRVKTAMSALNQVPVVNADVVTGFSMCILLVVVFGVSKDTYIPLVLGHVVLSAPFVYLAVVPKLKQMDPSIYEAALDLGATPFYALVKVIIPENCIGNFIRVCHGNHTFTG